MKLISTYGAAVQRTLGNEVNIINRREAEPLLAKAREVLIWYTQAMGCSGAVLDRTGLAVNLPEISNQTRFCNYCVYHSNKWNKDEWSCAKIHSPAEFQRNETSNVCVCPAGFTYWICSLYRNARYAGSLAAGLVLRDEAKAANKHIVEFFMNRIPAEKIKKMLEDVPVKSKEEIQAMVQLLGTCAKGLSKKEDSPGEMIRSMGFPNGRDPNKAPAVDRKREMCAGITAAPKQQSPSVQSEAAGLENSLEKERMLFAAYRRGDNETGRKILNELMKSLIAAVPGNLDIIRFRAIELVVLLSRAGAQNISAGTGDGEGLFEANNRYLKRIQESGTPEELVENLYLVSERLAGRIFSFQGIRHASVLRRAERYIWDNYTRKLSLEEIAKASGLSAPYFSTIFKDEMGENLSGYLNRLRVERAVTLLGETGKSLNEIASLCGFEDQSWFSKIFKAYTGISPGKFREQGGKLPLGQKRKQPAREMSFPESLGQPQDGQEVLSS